MKAKNEWIDKSFTKFTTRKLLNSD